MNEGAYVDVDRALSEMVHDIILDPEGEKVPPAAKIFVSCGRHKL